MRGVGLAQGDYHPAAGLQLLKKGRRHVRRSGRDDDAVKGCVLRPAEIAVAMLYIDTAIAKSLKTHLRLPSKRFEDFNAIHLANEPGQYGGLIAGAGPHLQHDIITFRPQQVGHQGDQRRLRDRLVMADGQRPVLIGIAAQGRGHELMPRHGTHGCHYGRIGLFSNHVGIALDRADKMRRGPVGNRAPARGRLRHEGQQGKAGEPSQ